MFWVKLNLLNSTVFTLWGNPTSWAELLGALLGLAMVVCNIRQSHWGWPLAIASSVLYCLVFARIKLYGDSALQVFFALTAVWGWLQWLGMRNLPLPLPTSASKPPQPHPTQGVRRLGKLGIAKLTAACVISWLVTGLFLSHYTNTDVPWWDGFTTGLSLVATFLLGRKYLENWPLWIVVNVVSIALFAYKGLWLTVILYALFAAMAGIGWRTWQRTVSAASTASTQ